MSFLESKTKFSFKNPRKTRMINEEEFFNWTKNHFYRTSYNDMGHLESKVIKTLHNFFVHFATLKIVLMEYHFNIANTACAQLHGVNISTVTPPQQQTTNAL